MFEKPIEVVCWWDPALDMTKSEREEYARTRDPKLLRVLPGEEPTRYLVRLISVAHMRFCDQALTEGERNARAFTAGVERVLKPRLRNGTRPESVEGTIVSRDGLRLWDDSDLEALGCYPAEKEIGGVAYAHSYFPQGEERRFLLPPSSDPAWALVDSRHAEKLLRDARQSSSAPSSERATTFAPSGDADTAATATA